MSRHFQDYSCGRSPFEDAGFWALIGLAFIACEHSQAVLDTEKNRGANSGVVGDAGSGNTPSEVSTSMEVTEIELPAESFTGEAVVDEENRTSCADTLVPDAYVPDPAEQSEADGLLRQMSNEQKMIQLTGVSVDYTDKNRWEDIQRSEDDDVLGIRGYQWRDGPHGLNLESGKGRDPLQNYSTSFPTSVAQGATFDLDVVRRMGEASGDETVAAGNSVLLGPCMNILRHPYWGRAQETFGEDSFHLGRIATAYTEGLQRFITGCAKHYLANNIENERFYVNAEMDEQTLREVYGRHFEMVVRDGGVGCIMASYNKVNGTKSTQNAHLLTEVLRGDFGFKGFVLTDWWAMPGAEKGQGPVNPPDDLVTAQEALSAGLDVEVPWRVNYDAIPALLSDPATASTMRPLVDAAVLRVLEQKLRFKSAYTSVPIGLAKPTTVYNDVVGSVTGTEAHAALAQELAEKAMVLLKNESAVLPISGPKTVAVLGALQQYVVPTDSAESKIFDFAREAALGDRGSSRVRPDPALTVGPLAGITAAAAEAGVSVISGSTAADAASADVIVVIAGMTAGDEGEEYTGASDRESLNLPDVHTQLINEVIALGKPTVIVIEAGSAVNIPWLSQVDAVVMAWYPGQRGGAAMGRLLFGQTNFAGRLPITWPTDDSQLPTFNEGNTTQMDYYVGYRRFDKEGLVPLFPFGYGLSYSTFRYERLHLPCGDVTKEGIIQVEVDVRNTAGPAGDEVILVFASYPETAARRSIKELKGFARVHLEAGQGKRVSIPVRMKDLKYWDMGTNSWVVESGPVEFSVGPSSDKLLLKQRIAVH